jgi:hypothetical protein
MEEHGMKLTVKETTKGRPTTRTVEYVGKPEFRMERESSGWRMLWLYRNAKGQRVATVIFNRGTRDTKPSEINALRRRWPETIEIRHAVTQYGKTWLRDENGTHPNPLKTSPYTYDEVFLHPEEDDAFDTCPVEIISDANRDWIAERDSNAERTATVKAMKSETAPTMPDPRIQAALSMLRAKRTDPAAYRAAELYLMGKRGDQAGAAMVDAHNKPRRMTREGWRKALRRFAALSGIDLAAFGDTFRQHAHRTGQRTQADLTEDIYDEVDRRLTSG